MFYILVLKCLKHKLDINTKMDEVYDILDTLPDEALGNLLIKEYPSSYCTPTMIENVLIKMKEEQLINPDSFFPDILIVDQLANRDTLKSDKGVQMDNVAESWGIPQITDIGIGMIKDKTSITVTNPYSFDLLVNCFKNRLGGILDESIWKVDSQKMDFVERKY